MIENDELFDALAHVQRRRLLVSFVDRDSRSVPELSGAGRRVMAAHESLVDQYLTDSLEVAGAEKTVVRMHHVHLPKLSDYGFVEWERDADVVTRGPRFDEVEPLLDLLDDDRVADAEPDTVVSLRR